MAPVVLAKSLGVGDLEFCDLMSGAHKKPEFLAKNPWGQVRGTAVPDETR